VDRIYPPRLPATPQEGNNTPWLQVLFEVWYDGTMTTITIPIKEYKESIQIQKSILSRLDLLQKAVFENSKYYYDINPSLLKRYEKISLDLDKGKGKKFSSFSSFKKYLKDL